MSKGKVTVLGINGHIGRFAAVAFVAAGWTVRGMGRSNKHAVPGVEFVGGRRRGRLATCNGRSAIARSW